MGNARVMDRRTNLSIDEERRIGNHRHRIKKPRQGSPSRAFFCLQGREILSALLSVSTVS